MRWHGAGGPAPCFFMSAPEDKRLGGSENGRLRTRCGRSARSVPVALSVGKRISALVYGVGGRKRMAGTSAGKASERRVFAICGIGVSISDGFRKGDAITRWASLATTSRIAILSSVRGGADSKRRPGIANDNSRNRKLRPVHKRSSTGRNVRSRIAADFRETFGAGSALRRCPSGACLSLQETGARESAGSDCRGEGGSLPVITSEPYRCAGSRTEERRSDRPVA